MTSPPHFQQIRFPEALELKIRASILRGSSTNSSLRSSKEHSLTLCLKSPSHTRLLLRRLFGGASELLAVSPILGRKWPLINVNNNKNNNSGYTPEPTLRFFLNSKPTLGLSLNVMLL